MLFVSSKMHPEAFISYEKLLQLHSCILIILSLHLTFLLSFHTFQVFSLCVVQYLPCVCARTRVCAR